MITNREAEIINKLLDLTEKEREKIWFLSSESVYVILENPLPPHMKEMIENLVAPIRDAMNIQYFLRLLEVPELREMYENIKGSTEEEREKKFIQTVNNMIKNIAHKMCDVIETSEGRDVDSNLTLTLYKCYHPKTRTFYLATYAVYHRRPLQYSDFSFYLTRDKSKAYELYEEIERRFALQRKTSTEKAESVQML